MTGSKSPSDPSPETRRRIGRVRLAGLAVALLAALVLLRFGGDIPGQPLFDGFQLLSPKRIERPQIEVVRIDPESIASVGAWPWPRYTLARLVEKIARGGAKVIGFDAIFPEPDRYNPDHIAALYPELGAAARADLARLRSMDSVFAEVIGSHPVVLARVGVRPESYDYGSATGRSADNLPVSVTIDPSPPPGLLAFSRAIVNIPDLDEVAAGQALMNGDPDADGVVRRVPLIADVAGVPTPGLAFEMARLGLGAEKVTPIAPGGVLRAVKLGDRLLPVDPQGRMALHFGTFPLSATISAVQVLRTGLREDIFKGKIVLIGFTSAATSDLVTTPIEARTYGSYVQAQAIDAMLRGDPLDRPAWARGVEWALAGVMLLIALFLFPRLRKAWIAIVPLLLTGGLIAASYAAFEAGNLLIDPMPALAIGIAAGIAVAAMLFEESSRVQRRLQHVLQEERVAGARAAGELAAARDIQLGMLPPREKLRELHPALDLDAQIEPARTVGGDFFDAMRLDDDRVCFLVADVTGKGVPAALFMALSKALAKSVLLHERGGLGAAVTRLNNEIARDNAQDMFVTMLVGVIDLTSGRVALCNAGHENPLRIDAAGTVSEIRLGGGPPLCVAEDFPYEAETIDLVPGEGLAIVTDGVTEAQDPTGAFFGHARLSTVLERWTGDAREAGDALLAGVRAFEAGGEPSDDVTVMALRWRG